MNLAPRQPSWRPVLLGLVLVCFLAVLLLATPVIIQRQRGAAVNHAIARLRATGVEVRPAPLDPNRSWLQSFLSCDAPEKIEFLVADRIEADQWSSLALLPPVQTVSVGNLDDAGVAKLARLPALQTVRFLGLPSSPITNQGASALSAFTNLQGLSLRDTAIGDDGLQHLAHMTALEGLELPWDRLSDAGFAHLKNIRRLESLNLRRQALSPAMVAWLNQQHDLKRLIVLEVEITERQLRLLSELHYLPELMLEGTITGDLALLEPMEKLSSLDLSGCEVTDDNLAGLRQLPDLVILRLHGATVTDACLEHLQQLPKVLLIELTGPDITAAGAARLQEALPKVRVEYVPERLY